MKKVRKIKIVNLIIASLLIVSAVIFISCEPKIESHLAIYNIPIHEEPKFSGVYIEKTIDEFNNLGFEYGDSVDIIFSNGYELKDLPYYSGYYSKTGEALLVGYPGYDYIDACINNGDSLWLIGNFENGDTASIIRNEKGKYKKNEKLLSIKYTNNRNDYSSDEIFANFRNVKVGNIKDNVLYRGASPIDNQHKRAKYANDLIKKVGIKYDIDLSDNDEDIKIYFEKEDFASDYFKSLYDNGKVCVNPLTMNYKSETFAKMIVKAMEDMSKNEGPYYIHCLEGKDRTGFLLMVIEGLAGASYKEMINDYMITYDNYYGVNERTNKEKYEAIKNNYIDDMLRSIADDDSYTGNGTIELEDLDWVNIMGRYLIKHGMTEEDIDKWYDRLTSDNYSDIG